MWGSVYGSKGSKGCNYCNGLKERRTWGSKGEVKSQVRDSPSQSQCQSHAVWPKFQCMLDP